ncbi:rNA polymerase sigma factor [Clostridium sp. CAG:273]|nr:sigma-70 family RNA polymerase sigma factor [Clostridia bacterium]CDE83040.1 rNA polymerase sigma factor [Clostridium sp. CAG:273]
MNNVENEEDFNNDLRDIIKAQNGNEDIMEQLIEKNKGLIWSIIRRFKDRGVETDDLYQIGVLGFIKSIKKFDTTFDVKLSTYAVPYIMGEVKRHIRDDGPIKISRSIKDLGKKAMEIQREHLRKTGQDISIVEVAKKLRVSKEEIAFALDSFNPVESIYNSTTDQEDGPTLIDTISSNIDEQSEIVNKLSLEQLIENLNGEEKQIIMLRYYKGRTQSEVAKILKTSQVQISRIEKRILEKMKVKLIV